MTPILWMGFSSLMATEPLWGDSLLFTIQFPGLPGTHLINFWQDGRLNLEATQQIWIQDPGLMEFKHLNHLITTLPHNHIILNVNVQFLFKH